MKIEHIVCNSSSQRNAPADPRVRPSQVKKGQIFSPEFGGVFLALADGEDRSIPAAIIREIAPGNPRRCGLLGRAGDETAFYPSGVYATDLGSANFVTVLNPETFEPLTPPAPKTRKVRAADIKPGVVFGWSNDSWPGPNIELCTSHGDGECSLFTVSLEGALVESHAHTTEEGIYGFSGDTLTLYPDARFDFGKPVTTIKVPGGKKSRAVRPSDVKPGDVFGFKTQLGEEFWNYVCTRVDGRRVMGVCLSGHEGPGECYVLDAGSGITTTTYALYPNARLVLGAPVTELPAE